NGRENARNQFFVALSGSIKKTRFDADSLLVDVAAESHGAGADPANVGVMGAIGGIADQCVVVKDRRDNRDVRKVRAAGEGFVDDGDIAATQWSQSIEHGLNGSGHRSKVDGDVGGLGEELCVAVEDRAG